MVVLVCLGLRSTLSLWFCLLAIEHIPKFHVAIMAFVFVIRDFRFHLANVKIMLELDSGLVLGSMVHRIPNIFCDSVCWPLHTFQNFMLESWLYFFWFEISGSTWSMWKSCSSLILDWCWALWCIGFQIFLGFFILYRFCICFHRFFVQNHDLVFQLGYVKIMLELDSGLLWGPRGPQIFGILMGLEFI